MSSMIVFQGVLSCGVDFKNSRYDVLLFILFAHWLSRRSVIPFHVPYADFENVAG